MKARSATSLDPAVAKALREEVKLRLRAVRAQIEYAGAILELRARGVRMAGPRTRDVEKFVGEKKTHVAALRRALKGAR